MSTDILTSTFLKLRGRLRGIAAGIAGESDADDVLHDAFCRLWSRHAGVASAAEAMKLSYTAVRNTAIDLRRRAATHPTVSLEEPEVMASAADDVPSDRHVYLAVIELARRVLTEKQYEIFRLHDIEGVSYEDIAMQLSMTQESIRMSLSRARKAIRELYRQQQDR